MMKNTAAVLRLAVLAALGSFSTAFAFSQKLKIGEVKNKIIRSSKGLIVHEDVKNLKKQIELVLGLDAVQWIPLPSQPTKILWGGKVVPNPVWKNGKGLFVNIDGHIVNLTSKKDLARYIALNAQHGPQLLQALKMRLANFGVQWLEDVNVHARENPYGPLPKKETIAGKKYLHDPLAVGENPDDFLHRVTNSMALHRKDAAQNIKDAVMRRRERMKGGTSAARETVYEFEGGDEMTFDPNSDMLVITLHAQLPDPWARDQTRTKRQKMTYVYNLASESDVYKFANEPALRGWLNRLVWLLGN